MIRGAAFWKPWKNRKTAEMTGDRMARVSAEGTGHSSMKWMTVRSLSFPMLLAVIMDLPDHSVNKTHTLRPHRGTEPKRWNRHTNQPFLSPGSFVSNHRYRVVPHGIGIPHRSVHALPDVDGYRNGMHAPTDSGPRRSVAGSVQYPLNFEEKTISDQSTRG